MEPNILDKIHEVDLKKTMDTIIEMVEALELKEKAPQTESISNTQNQ